MNEQPAYRNLPNQSEVGLISPVYSHPLKFFKKVTALDVKFIKATSENLGCWMFQMAKPLPGTGPDVRMDWKNSLLMKIGFADASEIFYAFKTKTPVNLFHKNSKGSSSLQIASSEKGGYWVNMTVNKDGVATKLSIALSEKEIDVMILMMKQTLPAIFAWN